VRAVSSPFVHELRVRYGECDPQGIVFNANYVAYVDVALTELWREAFGSYEAMTEHGIDMVVAAIELEFRSPARFDDLVDVEIAIEKLGTTSMVSRLRLLRGDELLLEGKIRHVFVDAESWAKTPAPEWVRERLQPYLAETA
jgi:acyl-CoA thioester hydrolase